MKKSCIIFLLSIIISLTAVGFSPLGESLVQRETSTRTEYLRIHVRANSNDEADQTVKYKVRDGIIEYLTPIVANCYSKDEAAQVIKARLAVLEKISLEKLRENGFDYGASAALKIEQFPTRVYGEYTLNAGEYLALIVELGAGDGANWWCVVYPPLCFVAESGNVLYKSKILEIIEAWRAKR